MKQIIRSITALALAAALAPALCLSTPAYAAEAPFSDVPAGAWYEEAVTYCQENGLMGGTSATRFSPGQTVTRGTLAVVLYRMAGSPESGSQTAFTDVPAGAWYAAAVRWAAQSGIMGGTGDGRFAPGAPVTREQLAAVLWRWSGSPSLEAEDFADEGRIASYARAAVDWARASGVMSGRADGRFAPRETLTRAQLAQVLYNRSKLAGTVSQVSAIDVMCRPCGLAAMEDGSLLVTDRYNKVIWRISGSRSLLFAGSDTVEDIYGQPVGGYYDGALLKSIFKDPWAIVPFLDGWAVSDTENQVVRFLRTGDGGGAERTEVTDLGIQFDHPTGLAVDGEGNLYVSETLRGRVRRITTAGKVTTLADRLSEPMGLCWANGALYVAECGGNRILRVDAGGQISVVAGSGENGSADGPAAQASFSGPKGVAVAADGTVYAADTDNGTVRRIRDGQVTTILSRDPWDVTALFPVSPTGLLLQGSTLYISDTFARKVLALPLD